MPKFYKKKHARARLKLGKGWEIDLPMFELFRLDKDILTVINIFSGVRSIYKQEFIKADDKIKNQLDNPNNFLIYEYKERDV